MSYPCGLSYSVSTYILTGLLIANSKMLTFNVECLLSMNVLSKAFLEKFRQDCILVSNLLVIVVLDTHEKIGSNDASYWL